jgi:hypothetical protein
MHWVRIVQGVLPSFIVLAGLIKSTKETVSQTLLFSMQFDSPYLVVAK